jgi:hypothetical protein
MFFIYMSIFKLKLKTVSAAASNTICRTNIARNNISYEYDKFPLIKNN